MAMKEVDVSTVFGGISKDTKCRAMTEAGATIDGLTGLLAGSAVGPVTAGVGMVAGAIYGAADWHATSAACRK